jgi:3-isopropylmalate/(R)-2-methylmalate dehydratase large subunit
MDHFAPNKALQSARNCQMVRNFAKKYAIKYFYEGGRMGIEHALLPEQGHVAPGELIIGADSHTCTYGALGAFSTGVGSTDMAGGMASGKCWFKVPDAIKIELTGSFRNFVSGKDLILTIIGMIGVDGARYQSLEFGGEGVSVISMDDRFAICNMAIEAGAKNGIFPVDEATYQYLAGRVTRDFSPVTPDDDAEYSRVLRIDLSTLEPVIAAPHLPSNVKPVRELAGLPIDQVVIGSCSNGRIEDLRAAARIMRKLTVHKNVRCIIIPATQQIYLDALREGLIEIFIKSGATVSMPTCGPCNGGHVGVLADNERCVSTTNRNFVGRMGAISSEIYLASPAVAAVAAVKGKIAMPIDGLEVDDL